MLIFPLIRSSAIPDATLSYADRYGDSANQTSYTATGIGIGTAAANRTLIITSTGFGFNTTTRHSSLTVDGSAATAIGTEAVNSEEVGRIWVIDYPTGTTADIVLTFDGTQGGCDIGVFAAYGISTTAHDFQKDQDGGISPSVSLNVPAGGVAVAVGVSQEAAGSTWTGLTERWDDTLQAGVSGTGAGDAFASVQSGLTVSVDFSSSENVLLAASFPKG